MSFNRFIKLLFHVYNLFIIVFNLHFYISYLLIALRKLGFNLVLDRFIILILPIDKPINLCLKRLYSPHPLLLALFIILKLIFKPVHINKFIGDGLTVEHGVEVVSEATELVEDLDDGHQIWRILLVLEVVISIPNYSNEQVHIKSNSKLSEYHIQDPFLRWLRIWAFSK